MTMFNKVTKTFQWGQQHRHHGNRRNRPPGQRRRAGQHRRHRGAGHRGGQDRGPKPGQDFFPLTVDYIEKTYAAGKIPGSFFKREGRPSELETLTSRLIDRPIRPLFPEGFFNEVHVVIHTLSLNPEVDADIAALIAASAALAISGIPFNGPIGAARVGYVNGEYVLNPGQTAAQDQPDGPGRGRHRSRRADGRVRSRSSCPKKSCWAPWCSATSRATSPSTRSTNWCVTPASRCGTGRRRPRTKP